MVSPENFFDVGGPSNGAAAAREESSMDVDSSSLPFRSRQPRPRNDPIRLQEEIEKEDALRWAAAQTFFDYRSLSEDHIRSFNNFVESDIFEMFNEAEPFEFDVDFSDSHGKRKVVISFADLELNQKPEVEKEDREQEKEEEEEADGGKSGRKGGDKGKASASNGSGKVKVSWLVDSEETGDPGASSRGEADGNAGAAENGNGDAMDTEEDGHGDLKKRGKGKSVKYNLNVVTNGTGNDQDDGSPDLSEEPPKISQETWGLDDPAGKEDMMDAVDDFASKLEDSDGMESEQEGPSKIEKAKGKKKSEGKGKDPGSDPGPSGKGKRSRKPNLTLLPVEARLRGITYSSPLFAKVTMEIRDMSASVGKSKKSASSSKGRGETKEERVLLGRIPVMVKSSLCHLSESSEKSRGDCCLDPGGYFIIKGSEKVIVAQEERSLSRVWVSCIRGVWTASCTSRRRGFAYYNYHRALVKLAAAPKKAGASQSVAPPLITVTLPGVEPIPVGVLFCALDISSDRQILETICYNFDDSELLQVVCPSLLDSENALAGVFRELDSKTFDRLENWRDKRVALFYIGSKISYKTGVEEDGGSDVTTTESWSVREVSAAQELLKSRLLPHFGTDERSKALFLAYMVRTICLCHLGQQKATDRDDFKNKRLEFAGEIIGHQFRKLMGQVLNTMKKRIQKHLSKGQGAQSVETYLDDKVITRGLKVAFSSGNWKGHDTVKNSGIVFDLKRGNPISTLCQLRELRHFVPPTTRVGDEARHPTFSQWGRVCPIDTPDGESCGLVKNMALTGVVSKWTPEENVVKVLASEMTELGSLTDLSSLQDAVKVFVNGRWIGTLESEDADTAVETLREARRTSLVSKSNDDLTQVEVAIDHKTREIHVSTDGGRVLRPLLIVKDQALVLTEEHVVNFSYGVQKSKRFEWLMRHGVVELLGIEEEERAMIALHGEDIIRAKDMVAGGRIAPKFTHAELHPSLILGLSASLIPFPNRNQSSRNLFQAHKHSKQAIGIYVTNITSRADTAGQHLFYPQVQLVKTNTFQCLQREEIFSGQNAIVAIATYTGYNQEDSIIMNQSSLDRGMFRTTHFRTFRTEIKPGLEKFGKPQEVEGGPKLSRSIENLDAEGLPGIGVCLGVGDVIVGKVPKEDKKTEKKTESTVDTSIRSSDQSQRLKAHEKGTVQQVVLVQDEEGTKIAKVKLRETRMPQVGDKFSSMHGQKGIVGMVFTQEDLLFTNEGIVPDIIINPNAFPSRQTLGQMCESALGKVIAKTGEKLYATPFNPSVTVESILDALHKCGYQRWGTETMYNGFTGNPIEAKIFIGSTFYQRLTHMVEDKIKYRSRGYVHPLTRQPVADRKRHGGVKFGEMERDCLIAHGAAATLQERSFILSDFHTVHVCTQCEQLANWNSARVPECRHCIKEKRKGNAIVKVELPYACKLLMQELMSMSISVRLKTEKL